MTGKSLTVRAVAELVGGTVEGDDSRQICSVATIEDATPTDLTYAVSGKHARTASIISFFNTIPLSSF